MERSLSSLPVFMGEKLDQVVDMDNLDTSVCTICFPHSQFNSLNSHAATTNSSNKPSRINTPNTTH